MEFLRRAATVFCSSTMVVVSRDCDVGTRGRDATSDDVTIADVMGDLVRSITVLAFSGYSSTFSACGRAVAGLLDI